MAKGFKLGVCYSGMQFPYGKGSAHSICVPLAYESPLAELP